jgi:group I intron endonuclease
MEPEYIGFVYMWVNKLNNKKYIGLHKGLINDGYVGSGYLFKKAVIKYGIENFERIILYIEKEKLQQLYQKEYDFIEEYDAVDDKMFYNLTNFDPKFVKWVKGTFTRSFSEESKQKMSESSKGKIATDKTKNKMSDKRKGRIHINNGAKETTIFLKDGIPIGWVRGRLYKLPTGKGEYWYTNGIEDKRCKLENAPEGWIRGKTKGKRFGKENSFFGKHHSTETKEKISKTKLGEQN